MPSDDRSLRGGIYFSFVLERIEMTGTKYERKDEENTCLSCINMCEAKCWRVRKLEGRFHHIFGLVLQAFLCCNILNGGYFTIMSKINSIQKCFVLSTYLCVQAY